MNVQSFCLILENLIILPRKLLLNKTVRLSGTCDLLLMYDESEVRKIVKNCEAVKSYFPVCLEVKFCCFIHY